MPDSRKSPVAMFVYNRLDNVVRTLNALVANTLAPETDLFVFSDGGRDELSWHQVGLVRDYLRGFQQHEVKEKRRLGSMTLIERPENFYLERNIIEGIAHVFGMYDTVIVLEDDIVTSPYFLQFMNDAFTLYRDVPRVMHVSGFTNLALDCSSRSASSDFYFTPHMSGWGWGTWRDRWERFFHHYTSREEALTGMTPSDIDAIEYGGVFPCLRSLDKDPIPWDTCWEIAIYKENGLCLSPSNTLVRNIGLKNGTHFRSFRILQWYEFDREPIKHPLHLTRTDYPEKETETEDMFRQAIRDWGIRYTWLGKIVRWCYKKCIIK